MKFGPVIIDFNKLLEDFPFSTEHIIETLYNKTKVSYEVKEKENQSVDPMDDDTRVTITYTDDMNDEISFNLLLNSKYFSFK